MKRSDLKRSMAPQQINMGKHKHTFFHNPKGVKDTNLVSKQPY